MLDLDKQNRITRWILVKKKRKHNKRVRETSNDSLSKAVKSKACVLQCGRQRPATDSTEALVKIHHINYDLTNC